MIVKAVFDDPKIFKTVFESISRFITEVEMVFTSEGLKVSALDKSHVIFVVLEINAGGFDVYDFNGDGTVKVVLDSEELIKVLKRGKKDDILEIRVLDEKVEVVFEDESLRTFTLRLIDIDYETPEPPELDLPAVIELPVNIFNDFLKDAELFSDKVTITIVQEEFIVGSEGDFGECQNKWLFSGYDGTETAIFTLDYLKYIMKVAPIFKDMKIKLGTEMPVECHFEDAKNEVKMMYLVAPRIENDY